MIRPIKHVIRIKLRQSNRPTSVKFSFGRICPNILEITYGCTNNNLITSGLVTTIFQEAKVSLDHITNVVDIFTKCRLTFFGS